jgi:hypothetical protein
MGNTGTPNGRLRLELEVTRAPDGRLEGLMRAVPTESGRQFSGVLELLKVLEDLLDQGEAELPAGHALEADPT